MTKREEEFYNNLIICDEDNKTFYSKDGKLYYRQDDTLVDGFNYAQ